MMHSFGQEAREEAGQMAVALVRWLLSRGALGALPEDGLEDCARSILRIYDGENTIEDHHVVQDFMNG